MKPLLPRLALGLMIILLLASTPPVARSAIRQVTRADDSGPGSLRQVLTDALPGDIITFDSISAFKPSSPATISVLSRLPSLTKGSLTIDASNAGVILDGSKTLTGTNGLIIQSDNNVIRGLTIQGFTSNGIIIELGASGNIIGGDRRSGVGPNGQGNLIVANVDSGIDIRGAGTDNNIIRGNYIGIERTGRFAQRNARSGIAIWQGARGNIVGGTSVGFRNVISGNGHNGVWISHVGTSQNVVSGNYIGTTANGQLKVMNEYSGVSLQNGASGNTIGGTVNGARNLISGNKDNGIYMSDAGTSGNRVLGNIIGPNAQGTVAVGHDYHGVMITFGASNNIIGDGSAAGLNLISANAHDGVQIEGQDTAGNKVQGNYIGANITGTLALPNRLHGVEIKNGAHDNIVGGNRTIGDGPHGQGNLLSGNLNHGLVIHHLAHDNTASGNLIGLDTSGTYSLGNQEYGGIDIAEGAHDNVIGPGNVISGNKTDGIALFAQPGATTEDNTLIGNRIGLALNADKAVANEGTGILLGDRAIRTRVEANVIAYNNGDGVVVGQCAGHRLVANIIYSNRLKGIRGGCSGTPQITSVTLGASETVRGTAPPNTTVDIYTDDDDEGRRSIASVPADGSGNFIYTYPGKFPGPNVTAMSRDANGNVSEFSEQARLSWTLLLYLNGDNDLADIMFETFDQLVAAGPSPRANVLVLLDGHPDSNNRARTRLYDITQGQATPIDADDTYPDLKGTELNMGDEKTLSAFIKWGRQRRPSRYTMLSIVDHGGGWAPSPEAIPAGALPRRQASWLAGGSGLSWDFTSPTSNDYDYLESQELRRAIYSGTYSGTAPLNVVFYDVCLMGMVEVAYQLTGLASYFISSQNIGWAPLGSPGRYVRFIQGLPPNGTPRQVASFMVDAYAAAIPPEGHPYTIAAIDMGKFEAVKNAVNQLSAALKQMLISQPSRAAPLRQAYEAAQKVDYDSDLKIEQSRDGFVDLYDFAQLLPGRFSEPPVIAAANAVTLAITNTVIAKRHQSGAPWTPPNQNWNLDRAHGLSIFLPFGEDLILTGTVRLRQTYTTSELNIVGVTEWKSLIDTYYSIVTGIPIGMTSGHVDGLQTPDVTPPTTVIEAVEKANLGQEIKITWVSDDRQSGVAEVTLMYGRQNGLWTEVDKQSGEAGEFIVRVSSRCANGFAVQARDNAGNIEPMVSRTNFVLVTVPYCQYLPRVSR